MGLLLVCALLIHTGRANDGGLGRTTFGRNSQHDMLFPTIEAHILGRANVLDQDTYYRWWVKVFTHPRLDPSFVLLHFLLSTAKVLSARPASLPRCWTTTGAYT